jgi:hypothetical protein
MENLCENISVSLRLITLFPLRFVFIMHQKKEILNSFDDRVLYILLYVAENTKKILKD